MVATPRKIALLSVTDKTGLVEFAIFLITHGYDIVSTGGTLKALVDAGVPATDISEFTRVPVMFGGLVKTLTHQVHAGLLADLYSPDHVDELRRYFIRPIDLVYFNLYDIKKAAAAPEATFESVRACTDMGGVAGLRSGAKGGDHRLVVSSPGQLDRVMRALENPWQITPVFRRQFELEAIDAVLEHIHVQRESLRREIDRLAG